MAAILKLRPNFHSRSYDQWEWQESSNIWRRYPCTISHKLNSIIDGETIYASIYEWVYLITKHTPTRGTQTNLFTQTTRKIRLITTATYEEEEKETEATNDVSLYYNYSYANIVLIDTLKHTEERIKTLFYESISETDYEITLLTQVQLSQNNKQYENYRTHLKLYCTQYHKRKHEIETLLWSNCSLTDKHYAHLHHVSDILQNGTLQTSHYLVYLCRAIYIPPDADDINPNDDLFSPPKPIDATHVMDQIPLYLINFRSIHNGFDSLLAEDEDEEANMIAHSLFVNNDTTSENTQSLHSYSQPLLSLSSSPLSINNKRQNNNNNNYGAMTNNIDTNKTWVQLWQQQDAQYFASTFDINCIIEKLLSVRYKKPGTLVKIARSDIENICTYSKTLLMQQPVFLELESPINIVGDIHGQYYDLLRLFDYGLCPPQSNYLFLGDYVDRGGQSLECLCLLLCYKIKYEENFFLLRGNHENENINRIYGFYDECKRRYSVRVWRKFVDVFNHLPLAATICDKIFCVHGGLSPELFIVGDRPLSFERNIKKIVRPTQVGESGLICDLLWSDPSGDLDGWNDNEDRGVSFYFGKDIVNGFNRNFEMDLICRAHQVVEDGYEFFNKRQLVTIFSAPNYCGEFDNCGAFMQVDQYLKCSFVTLDPQKGDQSRLSKEMFDR